MSNTRKSINSKIVGMKVGDALEFPAAAMPAIMVSKSRAKYTLAPEKPEWEDEVDLPNAKVLIRRIK
ncbi:MAG: hypothetical protein LBL79_08480 [Prevotella sp.]|jgi:hypothetical protein|nr:hypothetical protein [Prevotella sp.]